MDIEIEQIGNFFLVWGESLLWDDRANRLYFVDCSTNKLHWLDDAKPPLNTRNLPSMPTGLALTDDERLVAVLDGGLYLVNPDSGLIEHLANYPALLGRRANDATVDSMGNLITGSLNEADKGSYWRFSSQDGWKMLDSGISNANGPVVSGGAPTSRLVFADTPAQKIYAYDYDPQAGTANRRRVLADTSSTGGYTYAVEFYSRLRSDKPSSFFKPL